MSGLFDLPVSKSTKSSDKAIVSKTKSASSQRTTAQKISLKGSNTLMTQINAIVAFVKSKFTNSNAIVIRTPQEFHDYVSKAIENGRIAIDTETYGLDPLVDKIVGICIYTPGMPEAYIPINHISYITGLPAANQMPIEACTEEMQRIKDSGIKVIMCNAPFDIRVIWSWCKVRLHCYFDCYIAARMLNENEPSNKLKPLHQKYVLQGKGNAYTFGKLFDGIPCAYIPISTFYLYAAHDAIITDELYLYQLPFLTSGSPECTEHTLEGVQYVFWEIEMKSMDAFIDMEQLGTDFDKEYAQQLSVKYHQKLEDAQNHVTEVIKMYQKEIDDYRRITPGCKLSDPINFASPVQLAILLYDVLHIKAVSKDAPRGTGEEILLKIDNPICKAILDYREYQKLLSTYIDKMPEVANPVDGRIHCKFNQLGADTGRTSSREPNLQNIPSHNKDIRKMFKATDGYVMLSSDYSAQEPRITSHLSQDAKMIEAYQAGKDVYSAIASIAFNVPYEECLEFRPDGTKNPEGKERRGQAKKIVLGRRIYAPLYSNVYRINKMNRIIHGCVANLIW